MSKKYRHIVRSLERRRNTRTTKSRFVLVFEDAEASPRYFVSLRQHLRISKARLVIVPGQNETNPIGVLEAAINTRDQMIRDGEFSFDDQDQVWIIVDVDAHTDLKPALQRAKEERVSVAVSNPCFEYWLLLHFEDSAPAVNDCRKLIADHLSKYLPRYSKGTSSFGDIAPLVDVATKRAETQFAGKAESDVTRCCPCTMISRLVRQIQTSSQKRDE